MHLTAFEIANEIILLRENYLLSPKLLSTTKNNFNFALHIFYSYRNISLGYAGKESALLI
jgi:hypothetical protein